VAQITLENLTFSYAPTSPPTLKNLNLRVAHGEAHALLGASGAGKTTLLNLLSGLLMPTSGKVLFDDVDVSNLAGRQRNVAQVFQFPVLYESLNVAENLAFPLRTRGVATTEIASRVDYICAELGLVEQRDKNPRGLSLFQKQLVAVGKALVRPDVSLVLLDEPLTAVEPKVKWRLRQTLRKVQEDLGVTMIYVTHDQTEALTFADRVSVLTVDGILQSDTPQAIYASPAHEFVGHFVGSPGMNFVPAHVLGVVPGQRAGFRPEWAQLVHQGEIMGEVKRKRVQGTRHGSPFGLVTLDTAYGPLAVRGDLTLNDQEVNIGTRLGIQVARYVAFTEQLKVGEGERV
jgi:glycerol transport system ATP-binding protein